jgi:dolichyl-diphosphooligosaccharide--protein glycosyltransferase
MEKHKRTHKQAKRTEDDISIDLSRFTDKFSGDFFKKMDMDKIVLIAFLLFALTTVFIIRMLPAALPATDDWAEQTIWNGVRSQVAQNVDRQYPNLPQTNRDSLIDKQTREEIDRDPQAYTETKAALSQQFKSYLRYEAGGEQYTYLGDLDSYFWMRYTRNWLETGTTCDLITEDGQCRDMYVLAPVGAQGSRNPSLHVFAIGVLWEFMKLFNPDYPMPAASFLIPVIIGMLAVIPAFFIGRRLGGNVGGLFAAILIALNPLYLSRSMGSDNDAWNIFLPLMVLWLAIEAIEAKDLKRRIIYGSLAGLFVGIHAATWAGWWFIYLVVLLGLLGYLIFHLLALIVRNPSSWQDSWKDLRLQAAATVLGVYYGVAFIATTLVGQGGLAYFRIPLNMLSSSTGLDRAVGNDYWPNVLTTVAELNKSSFADAMNTMGGKFLFFIALLGLILMLLPRKGWNWKHYTLLGLSAAISVYLITQTPASKFTVLALLALPIALILLMYLFEGEPSNLAAALIILVWFLATTFAVYSGVRFILLMIPAFGIAFGAGIGRIFEALSDYFSKEFSWSKHITNVVLFIILALLLIQPIQAANQTARNFMPSIDDAWWDTLTKIREESAPDAIINSWWDFGHWFKYVADRRVSADGTTQHTHVPHWLGVALVTPDEKESIGVLRMLNCGSDASPQPEGAYGAYGNVLRVTGDPILSERIVRDLVVLDEAQAQAYLQEREFPPEDIAIILDRTHCESPEDYFITSGDMVGKAGVWAHFGLWDFQKSYIVQEARNLPEREAVPMLVERFGYSEAEATALYLEARSLRDEGAINAFAAPWPGYITGWVGCQQVVNSSSFVCPLGITVGQQGNQQTIMEAFVFNGTDAESSTLAYGAYVGGQRVGGIANGTPSMMLVARETTQDTITFDNPMAVIGVLVDVPNRRILLADPALVQSTFTHLFYLDGRYAEHYTKFDDRTSFTGSRVLVWKVNWDGKESTSVTSSAYIRRE